MNQFKKILIVCPGGVVTGGPEALHHLASELLKLGIDAKMVYSPLDGKFSVPQQYKDFNVEVGEFEDEVGNLIIFPEIYPMWALKVKNAKSAIWWLSLDNFLERRHVSAIRDKIRYIKGVARGRRPWGGVTALKGLLHFSQSHYSSLYLQENGLSVVELFEPINMRFLNALLDKGGLNRVDEILYNPNKGKEITKRLMEWFPQWKFVPLKNFTRDELTNKFSTAKIYIDFGHHPGRDRMPREAAMHGCCVVTGVLGSANNSVDIPIPSEYKLNSDSPDFKKNFEKMTIDVFENFEKHHELFKSYRDKIMSEPKIFANQISKFFL